MMKNLLIFYSLFFACLNSFATDSQKVVVDLKLNNNSIRIKIFPKTHILKKKLFVFPKTIPGAYDVMNYDGIINNLQFFGQKGKELKYIKKDEFSFLIKGESVIDSILYDVRPTFKNHFQKGMCGPEGTLFRPDQYILNYNYIIGYFHGDEKSSYDLEFLNVEGFNCITTLRKKEAHLFSASDYSDLISHPTVFCKPGLVDTVSFMENKTLIKIAVLNPGNISAKSIENYIRPVVRESLSYINQMGISLPEYTFIYFLKEEFGNGFPMAALEHKDCSLHYLPKDENKLKNLIGSFTSHELLHLITPLTIRTNFIANMDLYKPVMSKHLWLYEGVTEYLSCKALNKVRFEQEMDSTYLFGDLIFKQMISGWSDYPYSITELSSNILKNKFNKNYGDVYNKGACLAYLLDSKLIISTSGKEDLKNLLAFLVTESRKGIIQEDLIFPIILKKYPQLDSIINTFIIKNNRFDIKKDMMNYGLVISSKTYQTVKSRYVLKSFRINNKRLKLNHFLMPDSTTYTNLVIYKIDGKPVVNDLSWLHANFFDTGKEAELTIKDSSGLKVIKVHPFISSSTYDIPKYFLVPVSTAQKVYLNKLYNSNVFMSY